MKRMFHFVFGVSLLMTLVSCDKAESQSHVKFPKTVLLSSKEMKIKDVYLKYPFRIRLQDSFLYVMDIHPSEYYCHKFEYPSLVYQQSFMKRGEAPEQFLNAENIRLDRHGVLWTLDANKRKIVRIADNLTNSPSTTVHLDEKLIRTLDFDFFNDSTFIVPDYTGEYRINMVNLQGEVVNRAFHIPIMNESVKKSTTPLVLAQAWRPFLSYNSEYGILAMVTQLGQVLEIYDIKRESIVNIVKHKESEPQFINKGNYAVPTGIMGYSDVYVGQESIYALFWGSSFADIKNGKIQKEGGNKVHVFTLDGTPKIEYQLDSYITGFHIDEKNKCIIGLDVNSNQPLKKYYYE